MTSRKVIQITTDSRAGDRPYQDLFALCDDGTIWLLDYPGMPDNLRAKSNHAHPGWVRVLDVPSE